MNFEPCCLATAIGSLPHKDPAAGRQGRFGEYPQRADLAAVAGQWPTRTDGDAVQ